jgi:hypothetical protein
MATLLLCVCTAVEEALEGVPYTRKRTLRGGWVYTLVQGNGTMLVVAPQPKSKKVLLRAVLLGFIPLDAEVESPEEAAAVLARVLTKH